MGNDDFITPSGTRRFPQDYRAIKRLQHSFTTHASKNVNIASELLPARYNSYIMSFVGH